MPPRYPSKGLRAGGGGPCSEEDEGFSNDEIAAKLYLSTHTVRTHIQRAMMKLHARDRAQLVVIAYQSGLARPTPPAG